MKRKKSLREGLLSLRSLLRGEDENTRTFGPLIAFGFTPFVVAVHALFSFNPSLTPLYLLPAWLAYRVGGSKGGSITAVFGALVAWVVSNDDVNLLSIMASFGVASGVLALIADRATDRWQGKSVSGKIAQSPVVAVMIDCEGFYGLDEFYGDGSGRHVSEILLRVLETESRPSDFVARLSSTEFAMVLNGLTADGASSVMERAQARFEQLVSDAGYECNIVFGCLPVDSEPNTIEDLLSSCSRDSAYLN